MGKKRTLHLDDDDIIGDETYHIRNPLIPAQPLRTHTLPDQSTSLDPGVDLNILHKRQKENSLLLQKDLDELHAETEEKIRSLSLKHSKKESLIRDYVLDVSSFKPQRKTNLFNAEVSVRAKELRELGEECGLKQARADVMANRAQRNGMPLPPERQAEVLRHAEEQRNLKTAGARTTNLSAARDSIITISRIESELAKLNKRTGVSAILIVSRGHLNDAITPNAFETTNTSGFCEKVFGCTVLDLAAKLESWNVMVKREKTSHSAKDLRRKCVGAIHEGLRDITSKDDVAMNYQNYDTAIVSRYKVHLIGWPSHIPFGNPSTLRTDHLQRLADALDSQECKWRVMSRDEIVAHNAKFDAAATDGIPVGNTRKERSDKNKKRGTGRVDKTSTKRQKVTRGKQPISRQIPPLAISKEFINDSEDEWEGRGSSPS